MANSKRPTKAPPPAEASEDEARARKSKPPPRRQTLEMPQRKQTMEVQMAWLEISEELKRAGKRSQQPPPKKGKKPPPIPGAAIKAPPMPVFAPGDAPIRHTMEVDMDWLEVVDDDAAAAKREALDNEAAERARRIRAKAKPADAEPEPAPAPARRPTEQPPKRPTERPRPLIRKKTAAMPAAPPHPERRASLPSQAADKKAFRKPIPREDD